MKQTTSNLFVWALAAAALLHGQTTINGGRAVSGAWDASGAATTKPAKSGTVLPASCGVGEQFFMTSATAGQNLYLCATANTWTQLVGTGGGGANTASNLGTAGVGPFDGITGANMGFRNVAPASGKISVSLDPVNKLIDLDAVESAFTLSNLGGTLGVGQGGTGATTAAGARGNLAVPGLSTTNTYPSGTTQTFAGALVAGGSDRTAPIKTGTTLPTTCTQGDVYFKADETAGQNLYFCTATNTWTKMAGSGVCGSSGQIIVNASGACAGESQITASQLVAHAATHQNGGTDEISTATPAANAIPKAGTGGTLVAGWIPDLSGTYSIKTAGGDLSGSLPSPTVAKVNGNMPGGTCTNQAVTALSNSAVPTCTTLTSAYTDSSIAHTGVDVNTSYQVTATHLAAALAVNQGGTGTTSTLTGLLRGGPSALSAAELSGDATTSGSNSVTVVKVNGGAIPASQSSLASNASGQIVAGNGVLGASGLTTAGALPVVTSAGTVGPSAITDDGSANVTVTNRNLAVGTTLLDGRAALKNWDACTAGLQVNGSGVCNWLWIGDSWTNNGMITEQLRSSLQTTYGNAGPGYFTLDTWYNTPPTGVTLTSAGTWTDTIGSSGAGIQAASTNSTDTATPGSKTMTATMTTFKLHYLMQPGGGSFTYKVDSGSALTVSTAPAGMNLFPANQSNTFTSWTTGGMNTPTTTSATTDPFGGNNAWFVSEDTSTGYHRIWNASTRVAGAQYTVSIYAKANQRTIGGFVDGQDGSTNMGRFNLSNGTNTLCGTGLTCGIQSVGNGWYRCWISFTDTPGGSHSSTWRLNDAGSDNSYTGDGASGMYLYGGQVNPGTVPMTYVDASSATPTYSLLTLSGLSNASHTVVVTVAAAGSAGVTLMGGEANLDVTGVRMEKIGTSGATASYYSGVNATLWEAGISSLNPVTVAIMFAANEVQQNITPASQAASLTTIAANIRAAAPNADIILIPPVDIGVTGTYTVSAYAAAQLALAQSQGIGFLSLDKRMGLFAVSNGRGLFNADKIHLDAAGGKVFANGLLRWLGSF